MKIGICIPFFLNGKIKNRAYERTFRHYASIGYDVNLCGSEGDLSHRFALPFLSDRVKYVEVPQVEFCFKSAGDDNLRKKFNDSLLTLRERDNYDWYCLVGANDIVPLETFVSLEVRNHRNVAMAGVSSTAKLYIDPVIQPIFRVKLSYRVALLPGLNAFSRAGMDKCRWNPYQLKGCETGAEKLFASLGQLIQLPGYVLMLKGSTDLNSSEKIKRVHKWTATTQSEIAELSRYD